MIKIKNNTISNINHSTSTAEKLKSTNQRTVTLSDISNSDPWMYVSNIEAICDQETITFQVLDIALFENISKYRVDSTDFTYYFLVDYNKNLKQLTFSNVYEDIDDTDTGSKISAKIKYSTGNSFHQIHGGVKMFNDLTVCEDIVTEQKIKASNFTSGAPLVFKKNVVKINVEKAGQTPIGGKTPLYFNYVDNKPILSNLEEGNFILCIIECEGNVVLKTDQALATKTTWHFNEKDLQLWNNKLELHGNDNSAFAVTFTNERGKISTDSDNNGWDDVGWEYIENKNLTFTQYLLYAQTIE